MLAQSKSSVTDQLKYVEERINEVKTLKTPVLYNGRSYRDVLRFGTGEKLLTFYRL